MRAEHTPIYLYIQINVVKPGGERVGCRHG